MTLNLDDTATILTGLAAAVGVFGFIFAMLRYIIRAETAELRPNGGGTIKDAVNRLEVKTDLAAETAAQVKADLSTHTEKSDRTFDEQNRAIANLAEAVKVAALSTPPDEKHGS